MSESYFAQYVSPNIVIVPTVSFSPPHTDLNSISGLSSFEQNTSKDVTQTDTDCRKHVEEVVLNTNLTTIDGCGTPEPSQDLLLIKQDTISSKVTSTNISHGIKELTASKYTSRNSLVDLAGFNIHKKDNMSSTTKQDESKLKAAKTKIIPKIVHSNTNKKEHKISSKEAVEKGKNHLEGKRNNELSQHPTDMEDKMKKYFKQLWRLNIEKIKNKSDKEPSQYDTKSKKIREDKKPKDLKLDSSSSKAKLKKESITKSKSKDTSKDFRDFKRNFIAQHSKSNKSKSEAKSSKAAAADEKYLSSIAMKRYKDFQNFIRHQNDNATKRKTEKQNKTESLHSKNKVSKPKDTNTNTDVLKKVEEKRTPKSEVHTKVNTNQDSKERVKTIKSVVQAPKKHTNIDSQSKYNIHNDNQDLRAKLSRKRTRSECFPRSNRMLGNRPERENLVITVKQDIDTDPKIKAKSVSVAKKTKKYKKIKLVINIECSNTDDSDDSNQTVNESPEDLSFLDEINVDEIVNSLNISHNPIESEKNIKSETSSLISETIKKDIKLNSTEEYKFKGSPINDLNMKTKTIKKLTTGNNNGKEVIVIDSDAADEDFVLKTETVTKTSLNQSGEKMKKNSENNKRMKQKEKSHAHTDTINLNEEKKDSIQKVTNIIHEKKHNKTSKGSTEDIIRSESNEQLIKPKRCSESDQDKPLGHTKNESHESVNKIKQETNIPKNKSTINTSNENVPKRKRLHAQKTEDRTQKSLETVNKVKKRSVARCEELLPVSDRKKAETRLHKCKDSIEVSLLSIFDDGIKTDMGHLNVSDKHIREKTNTLCTRKSGDTVEASLESMFNNIKRSDINVDIFPPNNHIKKQKPEENKVPSVIRDTNTDQNSDITKIDMHQENRDSKHLKRDSKSNVNHLNDNTDIIPTPTQDNVKEKKHNKTHITTSNICDANLTKKLENDLQNTENTTTKSLNAVKYSVEQKGKPVSKFEDKGKGTAETPHNSKNTTKTSTKTPTNNTENKIKVSMDTKKQIEEKLLHESENINKNVHGTVNNKTQKADIQTNIEPICESDKNETGKAENLTKPKEIGSKKNNATTKSNIEITNKTASIPENNIKGKTEKHSQDLQNTNQNSFKTVNTIKQKTDVHVIKTVKNVIAQKLDNTNIKSIKRVKKIIELKTNLQVDTTPQSKSGNIKEKIEISHKSKDTIETSIETPINKIVEASITSTKTSDTNIKEKHLLVSEDITEKSLETVKSVITQSENKIDIEPINTPVDNITEKATHLVKSKILTEKSKESVNCDIQQKTNIREADTSTKISVTTKEKSLSTINTAVNSVENKDTIKTVADVKRVTPPKTVKNDGPKPGTKDVETKIENSKITNKDIKTNKHDVTQETKLNTNTKQKQVNNNEKKDSNGTENTDSKVQKEETKSKKVEVKSLHWKPFVDTLQKRMLNYLDEKYTVTSLIHVGHFSVIYKCNDVKGNDYAIKVYNGIKQKCKPMQIDGMLSNLQKCASNGYSYLLFNMTSLKVEGQWCFMTEFYPINLKEALEENYTSFHIDLVQMLSRQLVAAVNMLTDNDIIHSDIKPSHILLNSAKDRLKLTGFERSNYSSYMNILPCTGTASYRAPEIILGFSADSRIDIWATALVMFEMATSTKLFPGIFNNDILYKHICTLGSFELDMITNSRYASTYFVGTSFIRQLGPHGKNSLLVHAFRRNQKLRNTIFVSYKNHWKPYRSKWQVAEDMQKLETFHSLLEKMLMLDPRHRLPIQFVSASEFIHDMFA